MVGLCAGDEVLEEKGVAGTALDDGSEPVAQLEPQCGSGPGRLERQRM